MIIKEKRVPLHENGAIFHFPEWYSKGTVIVPFFSELFFPTRVKERAELCQIGEEVIEHFTPLLNLANYLPGL